MEEETRDEQAFMVRFEAMRKQLPGMSGSGCANSGSTSVRNRQLLVTHGELNRQCKVILCGIEYDTRMATSEHTRERKMIEARQERIKADQKRITREARRTHAILDASNGRHQQEMIKRMIGEERLQRSIEEDRQLEIDDMLEIIEQLPIPSSVKKHLEEPVLRGQFRIKV